MDGAVAPPSAAIERALEEATGVRAGLTTGPVPLTGGLSAQLFTFRLEEVPGSRRGELVLRLPARGRSIRREAVVQQEVAAQGYPAPDVLVMNDEPANPLGQPFLVMAKVPGHPLFVDAGPIELLKAFRHVPDVLAQLMADLHDLDPAPVSTALAAAGVSEGELGARAVLNELRDSIGATGAPGLRALAAWLEANRPASSDTTVCHGDLHALNVLDDAGRSSVIDWELATVGQPAFDVARTSLLLNAVPVEMPRPVRAVVQRLGRRSAARFQAAYAGRRPLDRNELSWYEALHASRIIGRLLQRDPEGGDPVLDAWRPTAPLLASRLRTITGVDVAPDFRS